ncbi:MAG: protein-L-isoaspartate(D-aspartate) O-methyltransferase [Firmicutes bacterium]|nr:protein-L-isoaspartate(D-aspartate) O-methyltransferase [Bacillota bacterium]
MVKQQLLPRGINDPKVLEVFNKLPRQLFVSPEQRPLAYGDHPLTLSRGQTISQPYIVALMTQSLKLQGHEKILEIGTGSGYQTAVLAELAARVYTMERFAALTEKAAATLQKLGYQNICFRTGDGAGGWPAEAPFDCILVAAAPENVPPALLKQLTADGGRLIIPLGSALHQELTLIIKEGEETTRRVLCNCRFVPLVTEK